MQEPHESVAEGCLVPKSAERLNQSAPTAQSPRIGAAAGGGAPYPAKSAIEVRKCAKSGSKEGRPSPAQLCYLRRGLNQAGGKLPLFDSRGQTTNPRTIRSCVDQGWAEPWFHNPMKPDWLVCKLTESGRQVLAQWHRSAKIMRFPG